MDDQERRLHDSMRIVGLRATVTAAGFFKLAAELHHAGVIDDEALARIKDAMVNEISLTRPPSASKEEFDRATRQRLDGLFAGTDRLTELPPT